MSDHPKPFHNPFGALASLRGAQQPATAEASAETPASKPAAVAASARPIARAVVRLERTGRGGKEVTVVAHLDLRPRDRDVWVKALKSALGCGGTVEGDDLVLQGDQRARLPALLAARGVKKITVA